jgi:dipeptidyl-peptidase III
MASFATPPSTVIRIQNKVNPQLPETKFLLLECAEIFGHEGQEASDIVYVNWLNMCRAGLLALEFYSPEKMGWRQAHMQARFCILSVLLAAGQDLVKLSEMKDASGEISDIHVILDRSKIQSVGIPAIAKFLQQMMVYKATAQAAAANALFDGISAVLTEPRWLKYRSIVLSA